MAHRLVVPLSVVISVALVAALAVLGTQERTGAERAKGAGDKGSLARGQHEGKISSADASRRELVLLDQTTAGTPGTRPGTGTDKGPGLDKGAGADKGLGTSGQAGTHTFNVPQNAKVTLDGRSAELKDLRTGMYARVQLRQGDKGATGTPGTDKGAADKESDDKGGDGGQRLTAERIEAFTTDPGFKGSGTGTNKKGPDRR